MIYGDFLRIVHFNSGLPAAEFQGYDGPYRLNKSSLIERIDNLKKASLDVTQEEIALRALNRESL